MASSYVTKAISNFFKEIFLVFSIFLEFNIELIK
jgi:hypothetical protein